MMQKAAVTLCALSAAFAVLVTAPRIGETSPISESDFTSADSITTFNDLSGGDRSTPVIIDGNKYKTDDGTLGVGNFDFFLDDGSSFSRDAVSTNTSLGYIDVIFDVPVARAGGSIGVRDLWRANVTFFDSNDDELYSETRQVSEDLSFFGFEAPTNGISRIRFDDLDVLFDIDEDGNDESVDNNYVLILDDLRYGGSVAESQAIPNGPTMLFMLTGLFTLCVAAHCRRLSSRRSNGRFEARSACCL